MFSPVFVININIHEFAAYTITTKSTICIYYSIFSVLLTRNALYNKTKINTGIFRANAVKYFGM